MFLLEFLCSNLKAVCSKPFSKQKILDWSKLKEFGDDNFKIDENGRNLSENIVGKEEIARYEQFFLFLQCFEKTCTADTKIQGLLGKAFKFFT